MHRFLKSILEVMNAQVNNSKIKKKHLLLQTSKVNPVRQFYLNEALYKIVSGVLQLG